MRWSALLVLLAIHGCGASTGEGAARSVVLVEVGGLPRVERALAEHRGQPLLLNFWATWCGPCVAELPELLEVADEHESGGLRVLGVSFDLMLPGKHPDETRAQVSEFLQRRELALPTVIFDAPDYDAINERFELPGAIPVTLAIDREGKIVDRAEGQASRAAFERLARAALGG